jgi:hypothetical protein
MKTQEKEVYLKGFLTLAIYEGEWSASRSGCFIPGEIVMYPLDTGRCTEACNCILQLCAVCCRVVAL